MPADNNLFIEKRDSEYVILRSGVHKPIGTAPTQEEAIVKARKIEPEAAVHVERVRDTEGGKPDKWRKV